MRVLLVVQLIILLTAFSFSAEQDTKSIIVTQTNDSLDKALPPILSEETRKKIRAEEIFREEVKKTLVKKKGVGEKLIAFFNTNLGIFILSAIFLSGLSFIYSKRQERLAKANANKELTRRLTLEIEHRISYLPRLSIEPFSYTDLLTVRAVVNGRSRKTPKGHEISEFDPIFTQLAQSSLFSVCWELLSLSESPSKENNLNLSLANIQKLMSMLSSSIMVEPVGNRDSTHRFPDNQLKRYEEIVLQLQENHPVPSFPIETSLSKDKK